MNKFFMYFSLGMQVYTSILAVVAAYKAGPVDAEQLFGMIDPAVVTLRMVVPSIHITDEFVLHMCAANVEAVKTWGGR